MNLYGSQKLPFKDDGMLYHYTKSESLFKILENMTLKTSEVNQLNDLSEANLSYFDWSKINNFSFNITDYITKHCNTLSFSQNYASSIDPKFGISGINHPRMWAQYSENNKGACIAIRENDFLTANKQKLDGKFYRIEDVKYVSSKLDEQQYNCSDPRDFVQKNYKSIFFTKHIDWKEEGERRLFGIDIPNYLKIGGCIQFVCLGQSFIKDNGSLLKLLDLLVTYIDVNQLSILDICSVLNSSNGYNASTICPNLFEFFLKKASKDSQYYKYAELIDEKFKSGWVEEINKRRK